MDLLARREHSRSELIDKLGRRTDDRSVREAVVEQLAKEGLQSDRRFAEIFVRSRIERLYGPHRIRQELQQRGVNRELIRATLDDASVDWPEQARRLLERRFGLEPAVDARDRAKRLRYCQSRGFDAGALRGVLSN